ncbi:RNase H domain-containing protein [Trichonephila clavipes]|nr:RNase H domain-containing protein [Trichonephila clavipes]
MNNAAPTPTSSEKRNITKNFMRVLLEKILPFTVLVAYFPTEPQTAGFVASVTPNAVALRLGIHIALSMEDGVARASRRLDFYLLVHGRGKSCLLQWIPAHVNIEGNECADSLAKEGRNDDQLCPTITLPDANEVANYRLLPHCHKKPLIVNFDCSRNLTSIIARLRTGHFKGVKISSDKTRTYIPCKNCTEAQLTPDHILECPALTLYIIRLGMVPLASELREVLYSADAPRLAEAVQRAHYII